MDSFVDQIAPERFARYLTWCQGDQGIAHKLYARNVALAEAFYTPLHTLEIVLRNQVDQAMRQAYGNTWHDNPAVLGPYLQVKVNDAHRRLDPLGPSKTRGHVVAEMSFGFWTAMFNRHQHHLWKHLKPVFKAAKGLQRRDVSGKLDDIRGLRNRVAHYEPIVQLDLMALYKEIDTLTGWLFHDAATWTARHSRFLGLCPRGMLISNGSSTALLCQRSKIHLPAHIIYRRSLKKLRSRSAPSLSLIPP